MHEPLWWGFDAGMVANAILLLFAVSCLAAVCYGILTRR
jgi:hypothetical protein